MNKTLYLDSLENIQQVAKEICLLFGERRVFAFNGEMGVGKTTLIKSICKEMGVIDQVNSPTFSIVNEYETEDGEIIYHFDFYRIKSIEEAQNAGLTDYLYSGNICLMEWADKIATLLPENCVDINMEEQNNGRRKITIKPKS